MNPIAKQIEEDTGVHMEDESVYLFRDYILKGYYDKLFHKEKDPNSKNGKSEKNKGRQSKNDIIK